MLEEYDRRQLMLENQVAGLQLIPDRGRQVINLGDVGVVTCALLLGRRLGAVCGGVGSALADLVGGVSTVTLSDDEARRRGR